MPVSTLPDLTVRVAFNAGFTTPAASRVWTDVTDYVEAGEGIEIVRGRQDERGWIQPSTLSLTLDNSDGRFTPGNASGAYYPNVRLGRPVEVYATVAGTDVRRFTGYIDDWPVEWPGGDGEVSWVRVTAMSRLARLGRGSELRSIVEETVLADTPAAYYPLGEAEGATSAGSIATTQRPVLTQAGSGTAVTFGTQTGPGTDGLSAPLFSARKYLTANLDDTTIQPFVVECAFNTTTAPAAAASIAAFAAREIRLRTDGRLEGHYAATGAVTASSAVVTDGATHVAVLTGSAAGMSLYLDGALVGSVALPVLSISNRVVVVGSGFTGTIAHVSLGYSTAPAITDHATAMLTGFSGESAGARITRYADLAGVPAAEVTTDIGSTDGVVHMDTTGRTPLDLMAEVVATEQGYLDDERDGTLRFRGRSSRRGTTSAFTLSAASQEVDADLTPVLDDQGIVNDVTGTRAVDGAPTYRAIDADSLAEYGSYREDMSLVTTSDAEVVDIINWRVGKYGEPGVRLRTVAVDIVNLAKSQADLVLLSDIGERFTLSGLPSQAPASSLDLITEGYAETITDTSWRVTLNASPAALYDAWVLGSARDSVLGSTTVLGF